MNPMTTPPAPKDFVILWYGDHHRPRWMQAYYIPEKHTRSDSEWADYDEHTGQSFTPEGWYQAIPQVLASEMDYTAEHVKETLLGWMPAPVFGRD